MGKDPAFLFYPGDWLGGTMGMTFEEKGAYMELLMLQFNRGHMTLDMIGQTVGQLWDKVQVKFKQDKKGLWYNERLDDEKLKRQNFTESRRNNKLGTNQYSKKQKKKSGHMTQHMEDENRNENKDNNNVGFEDFWNGYDKKVDRAKCVQKWNRLTEADRVSIMEILPTYVKAHSDIQFRKDPATFFNNRSWEDVEAMNQKIQSEKPKGEQPYKMPGDYLKSNHFKERQSNSETKKISELIKK